MLEPAGSHRVGVSLGHPSGLAGPSELSVRGAEQVSSSSIATGTVTPPPSVLAEQQLAPRQPPPLPAVTAAVEIQVVEMGNKTSFL